MIHWKQKGSFGHRAFYKKKQGFFVGIFLAAIIAQLIARSMTDWEAMKNVLTVSAILTVLPMANLASPLLVMLRIPSMSRELYEKCRQSGQEERLLYELVITSKDLILPVDAVLIHPSGTICYCPKKDISTKKAEEYLNGMLGKWKLNKNARVITEERTFLKRLGAMPHACGLSEDTEGTYVAELLKNLSI